MNATTTCWFVSRTVHSVTSEIKQSEIRRLDMHASGRQKAVMSFVAV